MKEWSLASTVSEPTSLPNLSFTNRSNLMLRYAVAFFVIALIAAVFGFGGIAGTSAWIAKILVFVFLILFVVSLIFGRK